MWSSEARLPKARGTGDLIMCLISLRSRGSSIPGKTFYNNYFFKEEKRDNYTP